MSAAHTLGEHSGGRRHRHRSRRRKLAETVLLMIGAPLLLLALLSLSVELIEYRPTGAGPVVEPSRRPEPATRPGLSDLEHGRSESPQRIRVE